MMAVQVLVSAYRNAGSKTDPRTDVEADKMSEPVAAKWKQNLATTLGSPSLAGSTGFLRSDQCSV